MKFTLLYSSSGEDVFSVDPFTNAVGDVTQTGRLELNKKVIDFESDVKEYHLIIEISDQDFRPAALTSTCNVKILVNDINDNDPQFDPETLFIEITEQTTLNQALTVADRDAVSSIVRCVTNDTDFSVILATKTLRFDPSPAVFTREDLGVLATSRYDLEVYCEDDGVPARTGTQLVVIYLEDIDNNPPEFSSASITVTADECATLGVPAFYVAATDKDLGENAEMTYQIQSSSLDYSFANYWSISSDGGWSPVQKLDYDFGKQSFEFDVRAIGVKDTSKVGVTNLQIDLTNCNDEAPRFVTGDTLYFSVAEKDYSVNTAVTPSNPSSGLKDVQDPDSTTFNFQLVGGDHSDYFYIDTDGTIMTAVSKIDAEVTPSFNLSVRINDTDTPSLHVDVFCIIDVTDVNEFTPECASNQYTKLVSEDEINTDVLTVSGTDLDKGQTLSYAITKQEYVALNKSTIATNAFTIGSSSGIITVSSALDYEIGSQVLIEVTITDDGSPVTSSTVCPVIFIIVDVNDNTPVWIGTKDTNFYTGAVPCGTNLNTVTPVLTVKAIDNDAANTDFGTVVYEVVGEADFELDQVSGDIYVPLGATITCYTKYLMTVKASDLATPERESTCTVRIDSFVESQHAVKIGLNLVLERFDADVDNFLSKCNAYLVSKGYTEAYCGYYDSKKVTSTTNRAKRSLVSDTEIGLYVVMNQAASNVSNLDASLDLMPQDELYDLLADPDSGNPRQEFVDSYEYTSSTNEKSNPIYYVYKVPEEEGQAKKKFLETAGGIALLVVGSFLGLLVLGALIALIGFAILKYLRRPKPRVREPDWEARRNWKKAIRKARLLARLSRAKAIDPASGRVYVYNKLTRSTHWLTTTSGAPIASATKYNPDDVDDPNPHAVDNDE